MSEDANHALTAREKLMRKRYTRTAKWVCGYSVFLKVGSQEFKMHGDYDSRPEAEWMRDMLAVALAGIEFGSK